MKQTKLYSVEIGENSEGILEAALHWTLQGAVATAHRWIAAHQADDWKATKPYGSEIHTWSGGCDYIQIVEKKIGE